MKHVTVIEMPASSIAKIYRAAVLSDELYRIGNSYWHRDKASTRASVAEYDALVHKEYRMAEEVASYGTVWALRKLLYAGTMGVMFTAE